jgi:uncharacterized protein (DUF849 family)
VLATGNVVQVRKVRQLLEALDVPVATPTEAREMLQTKGMDRVGF